MLSYLLMNFLPRTTGYYATVKNAGFPLSGNQGMSEFCFDWNGSELSVNFCSLAGNSL